MLKVAKLLLGWAATFLICYLLAEVFLFRHIARYFAPNIPYYFDFGVSPLFQYSKSSPLPKNYVAIFGDSYAEGQGDWFLNHQYERMPDTQITHLLHHATGRDVVTFGVAGSGSIPAYLVYPTAVLTFLRSLWFYDIEDPAIILLYFYEGNDIAENLYDYQTLYTGKGYDPAQLNDPIYFNTFVEQELLRDNSVYQRATSGHLAKHFVLARFVSFIVSANWNAWKGGTLGKRSVPNVATLSPQVSFIASDKELHAPDHLQVPPLNLADNDLVVGMALFENSVKAVAAHYPKSRIGVAYIPSPASVYAFSPTVMYDAQEKNPSPIPSEQLPVASNRLCEQVRAASLRQGISFHDTRAAMRVASQQKALHGPNDWNHLNESGYRVLANEIQLLMTSVTALPLSGNATGTPCTVLP